MVPRITVTMQIGTTIATRFTLAWTALGFTTRTEIRKKKKQKLINANIDKRKRIMRFHKGNSQSEILILWEINGKTCKKAQSDAIRCAAKMIKLVNRIPIVLFIKRSSYITRNKTRKKCRTNETNSINALHLLIEDWQCSETKSEPYPLTKLNGVNSLKTPFFFLKSKLYEWWSFTNFKNTKL